MVESTPKKVVSYTFGINRFNPFTQESLTNEGENLSSRNFIYPIKRRDKRGYINAPLRNKYVYYEAEIEVGSRQEKNKVLFDTGSSDLWVVASDAKCVGVQCKFDGTYSLQDSSTGKNLNESFEIWYGDGTSANGSYVSDSVKFGDVTVQDQQFGSVNSTSSEYGVLGIGLPGLEATENGTTYDNFPVSLKKQGYINKVVYSLYLNSLISTSGSILFGGVDDSKYSGELIDLPIVSDYDLAIDFDSVTINGETITNSSQPLLDSGLGFSYLPLNIVNAIGKQLGGNYNSELDGYIVSCLQHDNLTFNFPNNVSITAPISNFLYPLSLVGKKRQLGKHCFLGIKNDYGYATLGENFLRNAYVKYDLEDKTIALAQVKYTDESSIKSL